jgi:AbrB family looped-hinge helix DNA binding protein
MSSKGQVVIPEAVRKALGLDAGSEFVVVAEGDVVILKLIQAPAMSEFDDIVSEARRQARHAGMKRADVNAAIEAVRADR